MKDSSLPVSAPIPKGLRTEAQGFLPWGSNNNHQPNPEWVASQNIKDFATIFS